MIKIEARDMIMTLFATSYTNMEMYKLEASQVQEHLGALKTIQTVQLNS